LLTQAEVLAAPWSDDLGVPQHASPPDEAVHRAIQNANPRAAIGEYDQPIADGAREALIDLLQAQASFHLRAGGLERRLLRRTPRR